MKSPAHPTNTRRSFLRTSGHLAGASALAGIAIPAVHAGQDDTIQLALVGCGGRGTGAAANAMASQTGPTKLVAMADVFQDRLESSHATLTSIGANHKAGSVDGDVGGFSAAQVDVPPDRRFIGFGAYKKAIDCLKPGDVVLLTTPCAFRWPHFAYAIEKGINVFMEKPVSVDGPSTRKMLALAELSEKKGLKVGVGLMCRHCDARKDLLKRIQDGQIGDILTLKTYRLVGPAGFTGPKPPDLSELLFQVRHYLSFFWASGGLVHDYTSHNLDECCWMKGAWPVQAKGMAGRFYRSDEVDQNLDHYSVEYTFPDGTNLFLNARNMIGCHQEFASYAHGTKGAAIISTYMHTPAKCRIYTGHNLTKENLAWAFPQPEPNPYQLEWDHLLQAIRQNLPFNEAKRGIEASLAQILGRMACHTGQIVTWDEALNHEHEFAPALDQITFDSAAPLALDKNGRYPVPQPGLLKNREY